MGLAFLLSLPAVAEDRGVTITFVNESKTMDIYAIRSARKIIGTAITDGIVDSFDIDPIQSNAAIPKNTGYSICVEAGLTATSQNFEAFVKHLKFIHPKRGTTMTVNTTASCQKQPVETTTISCGGIMGKLCPETMTCVDDPTDTCSPTLGGKDCSGVCKAK